jgi:hypothetical protein
MVRRRRRRRRRVLRRVRDSVKYMEHDDEDYMRRRRRRRRRMALCVAVVPPAAVMRWCFNNNKINQKNDTGIFPRVPREWVMVRRCLVDNNYGWTSTSRHISYNIQRTKGTCRIFLSMQGDISLFY